MAKMEYSDFALEEKIRRLEGDFQRQVTEKCLFAGAKVLIKEMQGAISERHHVLSGDMLRSVDMTEIHSDLDESYVEVYTQGTDSRGVSNPMKNVIINYGYYYKGAGVTHKKDPYLKKLRDKVAPRLNAVMSYQMELTLKELGLIE